jgi:hypothetical protein
MAQSSFPCPHLASLHSPQQPMHPDFTRRMIAFLPTCTTQYGVNSLCHLNIAHVAALANAPHLTSPHLTQCPTNPTRSCIAERTAQSPGGSALVMRIVKIRPYESEFHRFGTSLLPVYTQRLGWRSEAVTRNTSHCGSASSNTSSHFDRSVADRTPSMSLGCIHSSDRTVMMRKFRIHAQPSVEIPQNFHSLPHEAVRQKALERMQIM